MKREDECTIQIVMCSDCGNKLTDIEVKMHELVDVFDKSDMWCSVCWLKVDYGDMLLEEAKLHYK